MVPSAYRSGQNPLVYALVTQLALSIAEAERFCDAPRGYVPHPANHPGSSALEPPFPSSGPAEETSNLREQGREVPGLARPVPRWPGSTRRTFRAIVQQHPRANGKVGFTVRELCTTMRISAASLTAVRNNPGRLSVNAVMVLAGAMEEDPLLVLAGLLAEA